MESTHWEQQEKVVLKGEKLRKGSPLVITGRDSEQRRRSEAEDLRSKFEQPLRDSREQEQAAGVLGQAEEQARKLLELTRQQAEQLLDDARREAQQLHEQAEAEVQQLRESLEPGIRAELEEQYRARFADALASVGKAADALEQGRNELLASLELPAFEMVSFITQRLLMAEMDRSPQYLIGLIRNGLALLSEGRDVSLRLSPQTVAMIEADPQLSAAVNSGRKRGQSLSIEADTNLSGNAFRLLTDGGEVAFDLDETLGRLDELLSRQLFPAQLGSELDDGNG